jgi:UrcA family protein
LRIRSAAEAVCGQAQGSRSRPGDQDCVRETIDRAVAALGSPEVAAANASGDEVAAAGAGH